MKLAMMIFGSGHGLSAPVMNQRFYWLVDLNTLKGQWYTFSAGFGAQLSSFEFRCPKPGERRKFGKREYSVFLASRGYVRDPFFDLPILPLMWAVSWACLNLPQNAKWQDVCDLEKELLY